LVALATSLSVLAAPSSKVGPCTPFPTAGTLQVDVAIIGGGASGSYAAVALKDQGKSVAIIEKNNHLVGGNPLGLLLFPLLVNS
jgi:heterodisulfide reductase subunit A-like polyferredoxin